LSNLKEFSPRAIEVVSEADIVAAEDTRNAHDLLARFNIKKELYSLREHNEKEASKHLVSLIQAGKKVVYMSDAGYPGISDPGYLLVQELIANDICVSTISGSSAFINALVASGLETRHFFFYGFLSAKDNEAKEEISNLKALRNTLIFYEAPHRILRTFNLLKEGLGNRKACLARELTKLNEEYIRGTLEELSMIDEDTLKGEMVIIVEGNTSKQEVSNEDVLKRLDELKKLGVDKKASIEITSQELKANKNYIKDLVIKASEKLK
jgi:16S rRNA (cytidine1402-2'-O)-methyltransferase